MEYSGLQATILKEDIYRIFISNTESAEKLLNGFKMLERDYK
jgi:hypothetical protein